MQEVPDKKSTLRRSFANIKHYNCLFVVIQLDCHLKERDPCSDILVIKSYQYLMKYSNIIVENLNFICHLFEFKFFKLKVKRAIRQKVEILNDLLIKTGKLE